MMMTIDDCTNVKKQFSIVNMVKRSKSLQHNFEFHLRSSLLQQTNAIQAGLVQALMGKDTIISKLQDENAELLEENKQLLNKIPVQVRSCEVSLSPSRRPTKTGGGGSLSRTSVALSTCLAVAEILRLQV